MMPCTVFISDMHLSEDTPQLNHLILQQLIRWCGTVDALYLLGDIFDAWIGDDDHNPQIDKIIQALHDFSSVTPLFVMRGNRDFLLGRRFARASGAKMLSDPKIINLYGQRVILTHGDILCTNDIEYQKFRKKIRNPIIQFLLLMKPLKERRAIAQKIRSISEQKKGNEKQYTISDITEQGLNIMQKKYSGGQPLSVIHGHTHRPNKHRHIYNGQVYERFVIPDWRKNMGGAWVFYDDGHNEQIQFSI